MPKVIKGGVRETVIKVNSLMRTGAQPCLWFVELQSQTDAWRKREIGHLFYNFVGAYDIRNVFEFLT